MNSRGPAPQALTDLKAISCLNTIGQDTAPAPTGASSDGDDAAHHSPRLQRSAGNAPITTSSVQISHEGNNCQLSKHHHICPALPGMHF